MIKSKKGFTIIEVVLVLAIAGLIFLMVFIALPALQRSQRNNRRRQDMSRILSAFNDYQVNNGGRMPDLSELGSFIQKYVAGNSDSYPVMVDPLGANGWKLQASSSDTSCDEQFCDPDGTSYSLSGPWSDWEFNDPDSSTYKDAQKYHTIRYARNSKCSDKEGEHVWLEKQNSSISIMYILEGGSIYCGDNQ